MWFNSDLITDKQSNCKAVCLFHPKNRKRLYLRFPFGFSYAERLADSNRAVRKRETWLTVDLCPARLKKSVTHQQPTEKESCNQYVNTNFDVKILALNLKLNKMQ